MNKQPPDTTPCRRAENFANTLNSRLEKLMPLITPSGVLMGFLFSNSLVHLKPVIPWLFAIMTLSGALKLKVREIGSAIARPAPVLAFFLASHVLMPLLAYTVSSITLAGNPDVIAGFVLLFSTPTAVVSFIWVSIYKGNGALTLALILLDTILAPIVVPLTSSLLLGANITLNGSGMAVSLISMVVVPTIIGILINEGSRGRIPRQVSPFLGPVSKFCLVMVIAGNSAAVVPKVDFSSPIIPIILATIIFLVVSGFLLGRLIGFLPTIDSTGVRSLTFNVGLRNISAGMTIAIAYFPEAAALPAILGIIVQQTLSALMGKMLFGSLGRKGKKSGQLLTD